MTKPLSRRAILAAGVLWVVLGSLKIVGPSTTLGQLADELGVPAGMVSLVYFVLAALEVCVGALLLIPHARLLFSKVSFLLATALAAGFVLLKPVRSGCPCTGEFVALPGYGHALLIGVLLALSFWYMWSHTPS